jgi:hypothetical protein
MVNQYKPIHMNVNQHQSMSVYIYISIPYTSLSIYISIPYQFPQTVFCCRGSGGVSSVLYIVCAAFDAHADASLCAQAQ